MSRLLHLQGSPRGDRSRSSRIAAHCLDRRAARYADLQIETQNVWAADLPVLGDSQVRYLREWLGFCGLNEVGVIAAAPKFGPPDVVAAAFAGALARAKVLADAD